MKQLQKPNCKLCHGAGVLLRSLWSGGLVLCPCIPVLSTDVDKDRYNRIAAGLHRLKGLDRLIEGLGYDY